MAEIDPQFQYSFDQEETRPGHLINLPEIWIPFQVRNVMESTRDRGLDYKNLAPEFKGLHPVTSTWFCDAAEEALPPIDAQIVAQWESQGYTVSWNKDVVLSFALMLAQLDEQGNPIRMIPDNRQSFDNKANTMRMETVGAWNKMGVPFGDIPVTDPQTGQQKMQKQFNISAFVGGYFMGKVGKPFISDDGRVTQKIVDFMSIEQWQKSNSQSATTTPSQPVAPEAPSVPEAATPPPAPVETPPTASQPPNGAPTEASTSADTNALFNKMLGS